MESLAPPLEVLLLLRLHLESGESLRLGLKEISQLQQNEFLEVLQEWLLCLEQGLCTDDLIRDLKSPYRRELLRVLELGLQGEPILRRLEELELEMLEASQDEIERFLQKLPVFSLIPVLFLQFPAFILLLMGPILIQLLRSI